MSVALLAAACNAGGPTVRDAWVRATVGAADSSAAYFVITNPGSTDDTLLEVSSPAAASAEIHMTSTDGSGMTGMTPVMAVVVKAGTTLTLEPGGVHVMLMGLKEPLVAGQTVELHLVFENAGTMVVQAAVRQG